jgi:hypothetical protein
MTDIEQAGTSAGVSCIPTYTGRIVDPLNLKPSDIIIHDISHSLARIGRFTGHTYGDFAYSVAQHSCIVYDQLPENLRRWGLLHDAAEAYLNDIARPLKYSPKFSGYREYEGQAMRAIVEAFGLTPFDQPPEVSFADARALSTEFRDLMPNFTLTSYYQRVSAGMPSPLPTKIVPWEPVRAEYEFIKRFQELNACLN